MVSSFIAYMCGLALTSQVRACTVTLQQMTIPYHQRIDGLVERRVRLVVDHFGNNYLANGIALGYNLGYRKQIDYAQNINYIEAQSNLTLKPDFVGMQLRWEF
jgi:hypothetical protein